MLFAFALERGWPCPLIPPRVSNSSRGAHIIPGPSRRSQPSREPLAPWHPGAPCVRSPVEHRSENWRRRAHVMARPASQDGATLTLTQEKTGAKLELPVHPDLAHLLELAPRPHVSILTTMQGRPFTGRRLSTRFAEPLIAKAGLPDRCVAHGLRKAAARRLAEAGCSAHQIQSITGHASLAEVQRYAAAADRRGPSQRARWHVWRTNRTQT